MIKLLLADDEDYTREGLTTEIDWKALGIDEIMQAKNGAEAISIANWYRPEIILTDIKMPKVDGIEFAKELVEINPDVKIIFMSGFMEVNYLKSAIKLSAIDFIEKPIDISLVNEAIKKAVRAVLESRKQLDIIANQKNYEQTQLSTVLTSKIYNSVEIERLCSKIGFPLHQKYICILLQLNIKASTDEYKEKISSLINKRKLRYVLSDLNNRTIQVIISFEEKTHYMLGGIISDCSNLSEDIIIAVGMESDSLKNIYGSFQMAEIALNSSFFDTTRKVFTVDDYTLNKNSIEPQIYGDYLLIIRENPRELVNWLENLYQRIMGQKYYRKEQIQSMIGSFLISIQQEYPQINIFDGYMLSEERVNVIIEKYDSFDMLWDYFISKINELEKELEKQRQYSKLITDVMEYISKNYGNIELGVADIAEKFHLTASYINVLFKQETGSTIKKYISNIRIENAKLLIRENYERISDISEKCGYANANYFAKVFKEETGMTPVEYRKKI